MTGLGVTKSFAGWASELLATDIPAHVHQIAHRAMLDTLGAMLAGGAHQDIKKLAGIWPASNGACDLATGGRATAETAALINGGAAHFWDFDDTSYTGIMHGSAVIFPVVLALAQEKGASEEEARTAFVIGSEITYVLADICTHQHYFRGWWSTATCGLVGAAAAAARLLGCDSNQICQAIGLAAAASGGAKSVFGTHAKPYLVGEAAQRAIMIARFVASGLSGPDDGIEGQTGFLHLLNNDVEDLQQIETLGRRWRLADPGLLIKLYPVCSAAHAATEEIARQTFHAGLSPDDIDTIRLEVPKLVRISLVHDHPKTPAQAQFSLPFVAACAVINGAVRLQDLNVEVIQSASIQAVMAKVQIHEATDLSTPEARQRFPESARVRIILKDQTEQTGFCGEAYGMPEKPLSDIDFLKKFQGCLAFANCALSKQNIFETDFLSFASELCAQIEKLPFTQSET